MKKFYFTILATLLLGTAFAQPKLTPDSRRVVAERKISRDMAERNHQLVKHISDSDVITTIVDYSSPSALVELEAQGAIVHDHRKGLALVSMKIDHAEKLAEIEGINRISFSNEVYPSMKTARVKTHVNSVHAGIGLDKAYDGSGVVAGLMDTGIDPNHLAFKDEEGNLRVKGLSIITGASGNIVSTTDPEEIADFDTDKQSATHGTHVMGIMAGGYMGNEYYGVAPKADIYMSAGDFYSYNLVLGAFKAMEYAYNNNLPSVVNLSIGGNIGAHDANEYCCRYFDQLIDDYNSIVCISAGNEGDTDCAITHTFTAAEPSMQTYYTDSRNSGQDLSGAIDIWSKDNSRISVRFGVADGEGEWVFQTDAITDLMSGYDNVWVCSSNYKESIQSSYPNDPIYTSNIIDQLYTGYAYIQTFEENNRYEIYIYSNLRGNSEAAEYRPAIKLEGTPGTTAYCYTNADRGYFTSFGNEGWTNGSPNGSINHLACGNKTLAVGSYCSERSWQALDGNTYSYSFVNDAIVNYSSYGELADGRSLPHIVAPGSAICAAYSRYYTNQMSAANIGVYCAAKVEGDDYDNYWGILNGTSMASPHAAGIMVLWKQAFPELTATDAINIAQETAITDEYTEAVGIQAGAGKIDALAGIKKVIELRDGVEGVRADRNDHMILSGVSRGEFDVCVAGEDNITVNVYNVAGQLISTSPSINGKAHVVVPAYSGVFLVTAKGDKATFTRKVAL